LGVLVAQYTDNSYDPNEHKYNYPLTFDNSNALAFCLTQEDSPKKSLPSLARRRSARPRQTFPLVLDFVDELEWSERDVHLGSVKEEFLFLYRNYLIDGKNEDISAVNAQVARRAGKHLVASVWKQLFHLAFPPEAEEHTIESLY
jgi:hypothetical protein